MKQKAITIEGTRFEPHWLRGYVGEINGRRVVARQTRERDWIIRASDRFGLSWLGSTLGGGSTLRAAVRMAKERA